MSRAPLIHICHEIVKATGLEIPSLQSIELVGRGYSSTVFRVESKPDCQTAIKIRTDSRGPFTDEFASLTRVAPLGLAPRPYAHGVLHGYYFLVTEFILGRPWPRVPAEGDIARAAEFFSVLHSLHSTTDEYRFQKRLKYAEALIRETDAAEVMHAVGPVSYHRFLRCLDSCRAHVHRLSPVVDGLHLMSMCHCDASPENIRLNRTAMLAVDWDDAKEHYYAFDVSAFMVKCLLTLKSRRSFYERYRAPEECCAEVIDAHIPTSMLDITTWHLDGLIHGRHSNRHRWIDGRNDEMFLFDHCLKLLERLLKLT